MIQKAQNYSAYSEFLSEFRITPRIQNYSTYSELLSMFRITQRIHLSRGRAERRARNVSHLDPWGVLSAYHALILVKERVQTLPEIPNPLLHFPRLFSPFGILTEGELEQISLADPHGMGEQVHRKLTHTSIQNFSSRCMPLPHNNGLDLGTRMEESFLPQRFLTRRREKCDGDKNIHANRVIAERK